MRTCKMCELPMEENFECISYEHGVYFHSHCVGDRMMKDYLEKNGWIGEEMDPEVPSFPKWEESTVDERPKLRKTSI